MNLPTFTKKIEEEFEKTFSCMFGGVGNGCPCCINAKHSLLSKAKEAWEMGVREAREKVRQRLADILYAEGDEKVAHDYASDMADQAIDKLLQDGEGGK